MNLRFIKYLGLVAGVCILLGACDSLNEGEDAFLSKKDGITFQVELIGVSASDAVSGQPATVMANLPLSGQEVSLKVK